MAGGTLPSLLTLSFAEQLFLNALRAEGQSHQFHDHGFRFFTLLFRPLPHSLSVSMRIRASHPV